MPVNTMNAKSNKILIVDDDELILSCLERLLSRRFNLELALGPERALESVNTLGPYAVVLTDMRMPGMNGIDLLKRVHHLSPATVGLLLSGNASADDFKESIDAKVVFRVIQKPFELDEVAGILHEALELYHRHLQRNSGTDPEF